MMDQLFRSLFGIHLELNRSLVIISTEYTPEQIFWNGGGSTSFSRNFFFQKFLSLPQNGSEL